LEIRKFKKTKKDFPLTDSEFIKVKKVLKEYTKKQKLKIKILNIIFVGKNYIRNLNKTFLKKDKATDVLSFFFDHIGEIYICSYFVKDKRDFLRFIVHGFLHIAGYDHKNEKEYIEMKKEEEKLLKKIQI